MKKLIIEARVNEYAMRDGNANVPWLPQEIAADAAECRQAGASIIHFHGRAADGQPDHDFESYRDTILQVRAGSDIMVHPTLGYVTLDEPAAQRLDNVTRLAADPATKPEFAPMDMGSVNVDWYDPERTEFTTKNLIYQNATDTLEYFARNIRAQGISQYLVCWNISFTRQMIAFMDMGLIPEPAFCLFLLSDDIMLAGHPGTPEGLDAHTRFLPPHRHVEWSVCNYNGDLLRLSESIITSGGHISIGLGDYAYENLGAPSNADLVHQVAEQARSLGREVADVAETRALLGMD
ncbi:MAG: 3-keto-5-aminohexanoate cleavage protein [Alphaproteobacteria bacterium]|jgi:uncharacterized protein (DUF849 family)|nr:hypothetical protein [Rhodospirillaceae bacterium]MDP6404396.1 3-keto-5-aminohexanoate cleavage protein [Alphaproteobacteria bacterium]MDP6621334.1 3-keto-5-aminohexanoate cleavage protein [Alphaproteobacteria bacterium]|tara:strand:+ start:2018 stop:2896 length:879 start_codon:yes stop_codon:yes gene_type:complete